MEAVVQLAKVCREQPCLVGAINGQWSMVNACTPQGAPILGTGGEKNKLAYVRSHLAKGVEIFKKSSPVMVAFRFLQP